MEKKSISIFGATGSIGQSVLDLLGQHTNIFELFAVVAHQNAPALAEIINKFAPQYAVIIDESRYGELKNLVKPSIKTQIMAGQIQAMQLAKMGAGLTIHAIVGIAGLPFVLESLHHNHPIALANKESLICGGEIIKKMPHKPCILPVDSEHNAIFQCINGHDKHIEQLTLTASGGPFWQLKTADFAKITKAQALKHPNWQMGAKITIDSATLMNKGLEVIEAHYIFDIAKEKIGAIIHPQSIIHSMVHFDDGSILAQMGCADMRIPISYILNHPSRLPNNAPRLNFADIYALNFHPIDYEKFPCFALAVQALHHGKSATIALNVANEWAVAQFLHDNIAFNTIAKMVEKAMIPRFIDHECQNYSDILELTNQIQGFFH